MLTGETNYGFDQGVGFSGLSLGSGDGFFTPGTSSGSATANNAVTLGGASGSPSAWGSWLTGLSALGQQASTSWLAFNSASANAAAAKANVKAQTTLAASQINARSSVYKVAIIGGIVIVIAVIALKIFRR